MRRNLIVSFVLFVVGASAVGFIAPAAQGADPTAESLAPKLYSYSYATGSGTFTQSSAPGPVLVDVARSAEVAAGNVEGDATDEIVLGAGIGGNTVVVRLASGSTHSFVPFPAGFTGGVTVGVGNLDADGASEIVVGMATAGSEIRVFNGDGSALATQITAYEPAFTGGVRVAVADIDGDGTFEIVAAPGPGRAPTVKAFSAAGVAGPSVNAFATSFTGGVFVAAANLDDDAKTEVVVGAGAAGGPHVKVFDGFGAEQGAVFAFDVNNSNGVRVAAGVVDGAKAVVVSSRTSTDGVVKVFSANLTSGSGPFTVPGSDGDLGLAVTSGQIRLVDAAPRLITVAPASVADHTRRQIRVYGAGLDDLADDITVGTEADPIVVHDVVGAGDDLIVDIAVPAATPAGIAPVTVVVRTPGGTATHQLTTNALSVASRAAELRDQVTTGVVGEGGPHVRVFRDATPTSGGFMADTPSVTSGVRVARGDLDGDGIDEIVTAPGPGQPPRIRVFSAGGQERSSFAAYGNAFNGGVYVAVGEVDGQPGQEIITGADAGGGPHVQVFSSTGALRANLFPYPGTFRGGVRVATGDVDGDGIQEILTAAGPGGGPHVQALSIAGVILESFYAYSPAFAGGVFVAGADLDGDGFDEIVTGAGAGGGPHVRMFAGGDPLGGGFFAFAPDFLGGVSVARFGDELLGPNAIAVGAGPGGGPHVRVLAPSGEELFGFFAYGPQFTGGVYVAGGLGT